MTMSRRRHGRLMLPLVVAVAAVAVLTYAGDPFRAVPTATGGNGQGNSGNGLGNSGTGTNPAKSFTIAGAVSSLAPGVAHAVPLRITNSNSQAIRVQTITVTATGGTATCTNAMLLLGAPATATTGTLNVNLVVAGNASTTATTDVQFPVTLSPSAPNGCKDFTWSLSFSGYAVQA